MVKSTRTLIFLIYVICDRAVNSRPVTVNTNFDYNDQFNRYSIKNYINEDVAQRKPNAFFNRLPHNAYHDDVQQLNAGISNDDDADYDDQQTDKPVTNLHYQQQQQFDTNYLYNNENTIKKKKKRRVKRPCIPIQSYGSPLFSHPIKREIEDYDQRERESGKTLGVLLGGGYGQGGYGNPYGNPFGGNYGQQFASPFAPQFGLLGFGQPGFGQQGFGQQGFGGFGQQQFDSPLYNTNGGYPCIPFNMGNRPGGGGAAFDDVGNGGGGGGYPQTVIINRPGLFGSLPNYNHNNQNNNNNNNNRPGYGGGGGSSVQQEGAGGGFNPFGPGSLTSTGKPLWEGIVDRVQEFITAMNPNQLLTTLGDSLQGVAASIQNSQPVSSASNVVKTGYDEFRSLLF